MSYLNVDDASQALELINAQRDRGSRDEDIMHAARRWWDPVRPAGTYLNWEVRTKAKIGASWVILVLEGWV